MSIQSKILIVEHDTNDLDLMKYELKKGGIDYISEIVHNENDYCNALINFIPDIILSDYSLPSFDGATAFKWREKLVPETPFIFVSGYIGEEISIEFIKNGVTDYVLKDKLFTLSIKIKRALNELKEKQQKNRAAQDIKAAEEQLEFDRNNLSSLINNTNDLMWSVDKELRFITSNLPFANLIRKLVGKNVTKGSNAMVEEFGPEKLNVYKNYYSRAFTGEAFTVIEHTAAPKELWTEISFYPIRNGDEVVGTACNLRDITIRKKAEAERMIMMNDLLQRNKELEQFAYIVSHNLRAPVANMLGASRGLNYPGISQEEKDILCQGLSDSVIKLDNVVQDLNQVLQMKGEVSETSEIVRFSELVDSLKTITSIENIEVRYDFAEIGELFTSKSYLYNVFYNLISNSIKYRQHSTRGFIEIRSRLLESTIELIFTDNGLGIDLEKKGELVFGLYKRFHPAIEGKGMGLFMVKARVEKLGGRISVKSKVNKGTEFKIEFQR